MKFCCKPFAHDWPTNISIRNANIPYYCHHYHQIIDAMFSCLVCFVFWGFFFFFSVLSSCCTQAFSSCRQQWLLFDAMCMLLIVVASLVVEHRL